MKLRLPKEAVIALALIGLWWLIAGCERAVIAQSEDSYNIPSCRVLVRRVGRSKIEFLSCPMERGDICYMHRYTPGDTLSCTSGGMIKIPRGDDDNG